MEVIEIDGYTEYDKVQIAQGYLVPRQISANGLQPNEAKFTEAGLKSIIRDYTREAGVRNLEREIGRALRKVATQVAASKGDVKDGDAKDRTVADGTIADGTIEDGIIEDGVIIDDELARQYLGKPRFRDEAQLRTELPGVATGLAWTPAGGQVLFVEAKVMDGKGGLVLTGQLGDVMKESARIALSYAQGELQHIGPAENENGGDGHLDNKTVHLHVPAGAIPKDGPSAGVTLVTALISELTQRPVRSDVGMTGEVTLQGQVLPIGGVKQKVLAAHQHGLGTVILPRANEVDLDDVPEEIRDEMSFLLVEHLDEVLEAAIMPDPELVAVKQEVEENTHSLSVVAELLSE